MARLEKQKLERVQYWQGQTLKSQDFREIEAVAAQRRWWHNRALHNAYGPSQGLGVSLTPDKSAIEVQPGLAYDIFGRELVLQTKQLVRLPDTDPEEKDRRQYLLVRYLDPGNGCGSPTSGACWGQTGLRLLDTADFILKVEQDVSPTDGVPIALVVFLGQKRVRVVLSGQQAQPLASPLLASGSTVPGNTAWDLWSSSGLAVAGAPSASVLGVETTIDTSSAGFTEIPVYFAWLEGPLWNPQLQQFLPALLPSIGDEAIGSFTFRLWLPSTQAQTSAPAFALVNTSGFSAFAQRQKLYVSWIGCQCLTACRTVKQVVVDKPQILKP